MAALRALKTGIPCCSFGSFGQNVRVFRVVRGLKFPRFGVFLVSLVGFCSGFPPKGVVLRHSSEVPLRMAVGAERLKAKMGRGNVALLNGA